MEDYKALNDRAERLGAGRPFAYGMSITAFHLALAEIALAAAEKADRAAQRTGDDTYARALSNAPDGRLVRY